MRTRIALVVFAALSCVSVLPAQAGPISPSIEVISQTCRVWGSTLLGNGQRVWWDESDTTLATYTDPLAGWLGTATAVVGQRTAFLEAMNGGGTEPPLARAELVFRPLEASSLGVVAEALVSCCYHADVSLYDVTAGQELLFLEAYGYSLYGEWVDLGDEGKRQYTSYAGWFSVDPSHTYRLSAETWGEWSYNEARVGMFLVGVPEPGSTLLLLGMGLTGLGVWRRRRR